MRARLALSFALPFALVAGLGCHKHPAATPTPPTASTAPAASMTEDPPCVELAQARFVLDASPEAKAALEVFHAGNAPIAEQCAAFNARHAQRPRCTPDEPRCVGLVESAGTAEENGADAASEIWLHEGCAQ